MSVWGLFCCADDGEQPPARTSRRSKKNRQSNEEKPVPAEAKQKISEEKKAKVQEKVSVPAQDTYDGEQHNGVPHGVGTKYYVNGDLYRGDWVHGLKEGRGTQEYFQIRARYEGEWKRDSKNGTGKYTQLNGSYFHGEYKDGVRHGKGEYFDCQKKTFFNQIYQNGVLCERVEVCKDKVKQTEEFPTLILDKERFNSHDLVKFQDANPEIKEFELDFLLKYYGLCKTINLDFIDTSISEWSMKQVLAFLQQIDLKQYKQTFYQNKIKGKDLLSLEQKEMKQDLEMKLGDRKRLLNYIDYVSSLNDPKKKVEKKNSKRGSRRGSWKFQTNNSLQKHLQSIGYDVIEEELDEEWKESDAISIPTDNEKNGKQKKRHNFVTEDWEKYNSGAHDIYHSHSFRAPPDNEKKRSDITEKGSEEVNQREDFPGRDALVKRKRSEEKQQIIANSFGGKKDNNSENEDSSLSSLEGELIGGGLRRKKTEMEDLYLFLKQNQNLQFLIKEDQIKIIEQIGEGGYGKVYKGQYFSCPVAVKDYVKAGRLNKSREDFMKEVAVLSDLKHPNIVLYMGMCITINHYQLVTQFMEFGSLYDQIHKKKKKFDTHEQLEILDDIVRGMVYLHSMKDTLHRDLKSSNVLIAEDWKVKLCDFGLSGHKKDKKQKTNRVGTYQWMAPEVIRNQEIDFPSDVYSFGVIIWELLSEKIPYQGMSEAQITGNVGYDETHKLPDIPANSDKFIISIMQKCLRRDPTKRPSFMEIQKEIEEYRGDKD